MKVCAGGLFRAVCLGLGPLPLGRCRWPAGRRRRGCMASLLPAYLPDGGGARCGEGGGTAVPAVARLSNP